METKRKPYAFGHIMAAVGFMLAIATVGSLLGMPVELLFARSSSGMLRTFGLYFATIGTWVAMLLWLLIYRRDRCTMQGLSVRARGTRVLPIAVGLLVGCLANLIVAFSAIQSGSIVLQLEHVEIGPLLLLFVAVLVQSGSEELLCRGYLMERIRMVLPHAPLAAVIINSALFALLHIFNDGVSVLAIVNILLAGLMFSMLTLYYGSVWPAILAHTAWNYTQNIALGLPNSGRVTDYHMYAISGTPLNGPAYDVAFGLEGSVVASIVMLAVIAILFILCQGKGLLKGEEA